MRKETSNQFTEGLISDLNPIITPNTVLTDNLNGTIITYNGNEYTLQNDRGNYELENCRLSPNYIPVGVKEYGDILYIVSHNPLDDTVEIGSYPSPLMIVKPNENNSDSEVRSIIQSQIIDMGKSEEKYSILVENADSIIFNGDDYKLNPGDEYCLQYQDFDNKYKYETVEYYILDEESNLHNISDKIIVDEGFKDFSHVAWTIPGWLSAKARLVELSTAGVNIRSFYIPKDSKDAAYFSFDFRLNVNDKHLIKNGYLEDWCRSIDLETLEDIRFRVYIEKKLGNGKYESIYNSEFVEFGITDSNVEFSDFYLGEHGWDEWFGDNRIIWKSVYGKINGITDEDVIKVTMIPILSESKHNYKIVYDNLKQELLFDLSKISDDGWSIGDNLYQFYVGKNNTQYIYADVSGPKISSFPVNLNCEIYNLKGDLVLKHEFKDYTGIGENLLQIPYTDKFAKENIYTAIFKFTKDEDDDLFPSETRFLITSEIFNDFSDRLVYDRDISFDEWINSYWNKCEITTNVEVEEVPNSKSIYNENSELTDSDKRYQSGKKYNTFFPLNESGLSEQLIYRKGYTIKYNIEKDIDVIPLEGDLWSSLGINHTYSYKDASSSDTSLLNTNTIEIHKYLESILEYEKEEGSFQFADLGEKNFIDNLGEFIGNNDVGKITDYVIEVAISVTGNKGKNDSETEEDDQARWARCRCRVLKNNVPINLRELNWDNSDENNLGLMQTLKEYIIDNSKTEIKGLGTDSIDGIYWETQGIGTHEVCAMPRLLIGQVLKTTKLPFVLIKFSYSLYNPSDNWHLNTSVLGSENIVDFCFKWDTETSATQYYLGFSRRTSENQTEQSESGSNSDSVFQKVFNWNPVLIPLSADVQGKNYFDKLCSHLVWIKDEPVLMNSASYILKEKSFELIPGVLQIYHKIEFSNHKYLDYDLWNDKEKNNIFNNKGLKYWNIFLGKPSDSPNNLIYEKALDSENFGLDDWPYNDFDKYIGFNKLHSMLYSWMAYSEENKSEWLSSTWYDKIITNKEISGLHLSNINTSNKELLNALSDSYRKCKRDKEYYIGLYGKVFDTNASGDTETILADLLGKKNTWWFDIALGPLVNSLGFPALVGSIHYQIGDSGEREEVKKILSVIQFGGVSSIVSWTNKQWKFAGENRVYYVYGTTWDENPTIILENEWSWIKNED